MSWRVLALAFIASVSTLSFPGRSSGTDEPDDPADTILSRIAFGSCADQERPQPIWDAITASRPDLFLFIGDNIYADTEDMGLMKAKYDRLGAIPGYRTLRETCPVLATWDDHDYGVNDGGNTFSKREDSQQHFLDFFGVPEDSPRRTREGVYHAETFGPEGRRVQVILLDARFHRSPLEPSTETDPFFPRVRPYLPNTAPDATMLGDEQWTWLEARLREPAEVRILVSSIQVVSEDHPFEKWTNFPNERERLYSLIRETGASGVVVISGDRHLAELSMMDAGIGYPLYDLTSSGLNQAARGWRPFEPNGHRVATMNWGNNFGLISIDWDRDDPLIRLQIRDEDGETTIQQKVPLSLLQPRLPSNPND